MSTGFENAVDQNDAFDVDFSNAQGAADIEVTQREPIKSGIYHVGVKNVELNPLDKDHQPIKNAFVRLELEVFAGEPADEKDRTFTIVFNRPDPTATGDEKRYRHDEPLAVLQRLVIVTGIAPADSFGKRVKPNWQGMVARHFIIKVRRSNPKPPYTVGFLNVVNVWHAASAEMAKYVDPTIMQGFPMGPDPLSKGDGGNGQTKAPAAPVAPQASQQQQQSPAASAVESL